MTPLPASLRRVLAPQPPIQTQLTTIYRNGTVIRDGKLLPAIAPIIP